MNFCIVGVMNLGCTKKSHYPQFYLKEEKVMKKVSRQYYQINYLENINL